MKFGIIGNDQMVLSCIQVLMQTPDVEIAFVLYDVRRLNPMNPIDIYCKAHLLEAKGITRLNSPEVLSYIQDSQPDYLLSINNFWVIREDILAIPVMGTINFHNSIPSRYHGLNIPSWVIINGEMTHGAMWHFVERTIDTGDIIVFEEFAVSKNETASSLMVKCIKKGIELFRIVIIQLFKNNINRIPQSANSSYYGKKDYPLSKGYIDFRCTGDEIDRLVRGLNYLPFKNTYLYAKIKSTNAEVIVNSIEVDLLNRDTTPGKIVLVEEDGFVVECKNATISVTDAMDEAYNGYEGYSLAEFLEVKVGDTLL